MLKFLRFAAIGLITLLAACSGSGSDPNPTPQVTDTGYGFEVVGQYVAEARLGDTNTQSILVAFGAPLTTAEQKKAGRPAACPNVDESADLYIPMYVKITNSSPADAPSTLIGTSIHAAVNPDILGEAFALGAQIDEGSCKRPECSVMVPFVKVTTESLIGDATPTALELWSSRATPTTSGDHIETRMHVVLSGGGQGPTPSPSGIFLRLSLAAVTPSTIDYTITKIHAGTDNVPGVAGVMTEGTEKGAFYVPLDPTSSPCESIGKSQPMQCGSQLAAP